MKQKLHLFPTRLLLSLFALLGSMGAWAAQTPVNLTSDGAGGWYINMPEIGTASSDTNAAVLTLTAADLEAGKGTFKVYDDGGKDGDYSQNYDGYLIITVPEGCAVQLSGVLHTESVSFDYLQVYDGNTTAAKLFGKYGGNYTLDPLLSSRQSMMLRFCTDGSSEHAGLDLTVAALTPYDLVKITGLNETYAYNNGNAIDGFSFTVTDFAGNTIDASNYSTSYFRNGVQATSVAAKGQYTLTVTGIAPYKGTLTATFWVEGELAGTGTVADPYVIDDATDWHTFAEKVNGGETTACARLNANIRVSDMVGTSANKYGGFFDGNGHTLNLSLTTNEDYCAPFRYTDGAVIKRLRLTGNINTSARYAASIVARANYTHILNCWSSVDINSTYSGYADHGGIIADNSNLSFVDHTLFDGSMTGENSMGGAGMSYSSNVVFSYCLFQPSNITMQHSSFGTFVNYYYSGDGSTNNYYKYAGASDFNYRNGTDASSYTNEQLISRLGSGWLEFDGKVVPDLSIVSLPTSGSIATGSSITWSVSDDYTTLTFAGSGDMTWNSSYYYNLPIYPFSKFVTTVVLPDGITSIGKDSFYGFIKLNTVNIPSGVTTIGERAFYNCSGLTAITIPATVTSMGDYAFNYCRAMDVTLEHTTTVPEIPTYTFQNVNGTLTVQNTTVFNQVNNEWGFGTWTLNCLNPSADFADATITNISSMVATGEALVVSPKVTISGVELDASNYTLAYTRDGNPVTEIKEEGTYTVTATAQGSYTGTVSATFSVLPASISYLDENGETQTCTDYTILTTDMTTISSPWVVAAGNLTFDERITINPSNNTVNLILVDGATLNATKGIKVNGRSGLAVYAQSDDEATMGRLIAQGTKGNTAIGDNYNSYAYDATIVINGGKIDATGCSVGETSPAIGGKEYSSYFTITINGGIVTATSGNVSGNIYAICSGRETPKSITINGGQVTAIGQYGIGGKSNTPITLSWRKPTDFIQADRYIGTVTLQKAFVLNSSTTLATTENMAGQKLTPVTNVNDLAYATVTMDVVYNYNNGDAVSVLPEVKSADGTILELDTHYTLAYQDSNNATVAAANLKDNGAYTLTITGISPYTGTLTREFRIGNGESLDGFVFSKATDDEGDYYEIANESDLELLAAYVNSGHEAQGKRFKQTADIAMTNDHQNIGRYDGSTWFYFKGTFDGNGKTISGLTISKANESRLGLFGCLYSATIKNVTLIGCSITGKTHVGGIAGSTAGGSSNKSTIENCKVLDATITAAIQGDNANAYAGGITGYLADGKVNNCVVSGTISSTSANSLGGISGYETSSSTITNCENAANITGTGLNYGGIAGYVSSGNKISGSFNTGIVEGKSSSNNRGAIVGNFNSTSDFSNNYYAAPCTVKGMSNYDYSGCAEQVYRLVAGDNIGTISGTSVVFTSYFDNKQYAKKGAATLTLTANVPEGSTFVKYASSEGELSNAFAETGEHELTIGTNDVTISALVSSNNGTEITSGMIADITNGRWMGDGVAVTPALTITNGGTTLVEGTDYVVVYTNNTSKGTATATVYGINSYKGTPTKNFDIVGLQLLTEDSPNSENNPYLIATEEDLQALASLVNNNVKDANDKPYREGFYRQTDDITLTEEHTAIGNSSYNFKGSYDGKDGETQHTISGLFINKPSADYQGLFGSIYTAKIQNVVIVDCDITGGQYTGGVVGYSSSSSSKLSNCSVSGAIKVAEGKVVNNHGGVLGYLSGGTVENCVNTANVTGNGNYHGGVIGWMQSSTYQKNCFNAGTVEGTAYVGSLAGGVYSSLGSYYIQNNYHTAGTTGGVGTSDDATGTDRSGAEVVVKITAADGVTLTLPETATYVWNEENLYKSGTVVTLDYALPSDKYFDYYTVTSGEISDAATMDGEHTLTGFTEDVVIRGSYVDHITDFSELAVIADITGLVYNGSEQHPVPVVTIGDETLVEGSNYTVSYSEGCTNAGEHTVTITGTGRYAGTVLKTFTIAPFDVSNCTVTITNPAYTREVLTVTPTVKRGSTTMTAGEDKDYTFATNPATVKDAGTYTMTITGHGNYTGTKETQFEVFYAAPTNLQYTAVTATTATMAWTDDVAAQWTLEYSTDNTFATSSTLTVDAATATLQGLTAETVYYTRVKAVYGNGESDWSSVCRVQPTDKLVIGAGNETNSLLPTNVYYNYSWTQQIYTAAEMGNLSGIISSVDFYNASTQEDRTRNLDVYLVNTEKSAFSSITDWITVTDADKVFSGQVTFTHGQWSTITFNKTFAYDGTKNLAVIIDDNTGSYLSQIPFLAYSSTDNSSIYVYNDYTNFAPNSTDTEGTRQNVKNQVRFDINTSGVMLADAATDNSTTIASNVGENKTVKLVGRTLYKDGEWNTICLPFDVTLEGSPLAGATAKTLVNATMTGTHVELDFGEAVTELSAGTPYIIKWDNDGSANIVEPTFTGVTVVNTQPEDMTIEKAAGNVKFIGYYDAFTITAADDDIYYMTTGSQLKHTGKERTLNACRAYFQFSEAAKARQFVLNFGEDSGTTTGIAENENGGSSNDDTTYDMLGRKVPKSKLANGQLRKGLYIKENGKKVVIK